MNTMKKVLALVVAFVMVLSLAVTAFAYDITIESKATGHTFKAYQILKGTVTGTANDTTLGNPTWGDGVDSTGLMAELNKEFKTELGEKTIANPADLVAFLNNASADVASKFARIAAKHVTSGTKLTESPAEAGATYKATDLAAGYYLVKDEALGSNHDAYSSYMLKVVNDVTATAKLDYPDVEKDVLDNNDSDKLDPTNKWGKSADHDIGDEVEFKLTGTIPDTTGYKTYYYAFHDKMDDTLSFNAGTVKVTVGGIEIKTGYKVVTDTEDGCTFEVVINDLISVIDSVKNTEGYDASKGVVVTYTATLTDDAVIGNPGQENEVMLEFSNNPNVEGTGTPGNPDEPDKPDDTGKTEWKKVVVFTYDVTVNKVDADKKPLTGAQFTLEKFVEGEGSDTYNGKTGKWVAVKQVEATAGDVFKFKGLDDGSYRLTETKAPNGYNKAEDIYFEISAEHADTTTLEETENFTITNGSLSTEVVNHKGATLPETGGIGTVLFYVVGGLMVLFAGVLLITKRRMKNVD